MAGERIVGLSKYDEERILKDVKRAALKKCHEKVNEFIECTQTTYLPQWKCSEQLSKMNACLKQYTKESDFDKQRIEFHRSKSSSSSQ